MWPWALLPGPPPGRTHIAGKVLAALRAARARRTSDKRWSIRWFSSCLVPEATAGRGYTESGRAGEPICAITTRACARRGAFATLAVMLARVFSAAVQGIEAFPVEVEVNAGWGDTIIVHRRFAGHGGEGIARPGHDRVEQFRFQIPDGQNDDQSRARRREERGAEL